MFVCWGLGARQGRDGSERDGEGWGEREREREREGLDGVGRDRTTWRGTEQHGEKHNDMEADGILFKLSQGRS